MAPKLNFNSRTIVAPLAAFCMASILFVYSRTSIQAAKRNAQKHREADGGQINWHNESLRRHGKLEAPEQQGLISQLFKKEGKSGKSGKAGSSSEGVGEGGSAGEGVSEGDRGEAERLIRERKGRGKGA